MMAEGITISDALIAVVGKRRAGKTTLMSKLFDKNEIIQLSDKRVESQSNCAYTAVEVPGPENLSDIKSWRKEELKKLIKTTGGKVDLFLLCIPAAPYNTFNEGTPNIMKGLQEEFGKDVWKRCIVVFTFNNMFLTVNNGPGNVEKDRNMYKANLQNFTDEFRNELVHKLGVNEIRVKTIFQHTLLSSDKKRPENTVITIPAGYHVDDPVIPNSERNWVDDLLTLIHEKCNQESSTFDLKKHQLQHIAKMGGIGGAVAGVVGGAGAGAGVGALVGLFVGPIGAAVGALIGGGIGVVAGGMVGGGGGAAAPFVVNEVEERWKNNKAK